MKWWHRLLQHAIAERVIETHEGVLGPTGVVVGVDFIQSDCDCGRKWNALRLVDA